MTLPTTKRVNHKWHYSNNEDFAAKSSKKRKSKVTKTLSGGVLTKRSGSTPNSVVRRSSTKSTMPSLTGYNLFGDSQLNSPTSSYDFIDTQNTTQNTPPFQDKAFCNPLLRMSFDDLLDSSYKPPVGDSGPLRKQSTVSNFDSDSGISSLNSPTMVSSPANFHELEIDDLITGLDVVPSLSTNDSLLQDLQFPNLEDVNLLTQDPMGASAYFGMSDTTNVLHRTQ
eukprot:CFRG4483T1